MAHSLALSAAQHLHRRFQSYRDGNEVLCMDVLCANCREPRRKTIPWGYMSGLTPVEQQGTVFIARAQDGRPLLIVSVVMEREIRQGRDPEMSIPWMELLADDILRQPLWWRPVRQQMKPIICRACKSHFEHIVTVCKTWHIAREQYGVLKSPDTVTEPYIADVHFCHLCHHEVPVFWWAGAPYAAEEPVAPRPWTIKKRFSKRMRGDYWANTCARCGAIIGDHYLYTDEEGVFASMPIRVKRAQP